MSSKVTDLMSRDEKNNKKCSHDGILASKHVNNYVRALSHERIQIKLKMSSICKTRLLNLICIE